MTKTLEGYEELQKTFNDQLQNKIWKESRNFEHKTFKVGELKLSDIVKFATENDENRAMWCVEMNKKIISKVDNNNSKQHKMTTEKILKLQSTIVECEAVIELQEKNYTVLKNNKDELEKEYDEIINVLKNKVKELTEEINDLKKANKNLFDENCMLDNITN
jgi:hypothetical protein